MSDAPTGPEATPEMHTVGVLGGMSSASTTEYYELLNARVNEELGGHHGADVLVYSVDFADVERFIRAGEWASAGRYLADAAGRLERGGAAFVVMATNTMHRVASAITASLSVPFVHIVDVTADAITDRGLDTVGVLGTQATMEAAFYRDRLASHGVDVVVPDAADRERVDRIIFDELTAGTVRESSRETYLEVMDELVHRGAEGIVLGCTEIEMLVGPSEFERRPLFDTTALHVDRAVELSLGTRPLPE
jgi:aspartate racemase